MPSALSRWFQPFLSPVRLALLAGAIAAGGCSNYSTIVIDGHDVADAEWYVQADRVRSQGSLTLNCPKNLLVLTLRASRANHPTRVDVAGCDHQLSYERVANGDDDLWVESQQQK